jgi:hypothetical protein
MCVRFLIMTGMIMIIGPMIPLVVMMMINGGVAAMLMRMIVLMCMVMGVFVTMRHVAVRMLMGVHMPVIVLMQVVVFVFSFHHQASCL